MTYEIKLPVFKVHHEEYGAPVEISAYDARSAAKEFAEQYDVDGMDFTLTNGSETVVVVESPDGTKQAFNLSAERTVRYIAESCPMPSGQS